MPELSPIPSPDVEPVLRLLLDKPWVLHEQGEADSFCILTAAGRWVIAFRQNGEMPLELQRAVGQLLAAAPRLAFELEGILAFSDGFGVYGENAAAVELRRWLEGARAALEKAGLRHG